MHIPMDWDGAEGEYVFVGLNSLLEGVHFSGVEASSSIFRLSGVWETIKKRE